MKRNLIINISLDAALLALLIIASQISVKVGVTTFTLQLLVVFMIANICNLKNSLLIISCYILMGLIGIPVFASWGGGLSYITSPTFGFVYGFYFVVLIQWLFNKLTIKLNAHRIIGYVIGGLLSLVVLYAIGYVHGYVVLKILNGKDYTAYSLFAMFIVPYIPFDLTKIAVASILSERISALMQKSLNFYPYSKKNAN